VASARGVGVGTVAASSSSAAGGAGAPTLMAPGIQYDLREIDRAGVKGSCVRSFFLRLMLRRRSQKNPATDLERAVARPTDTTLKRSHSATTQYTINNSTLTLWQGFSSGYILLQA